MKIAILGYGVEGKSAEKFFKSSLSNRVAKCEIRDIKKQGNNYLKNLDKFDMVVRSPGIPYLLPEIQRAKKFGVEITSATKLFFRAVRGQNKGKIIGITGTKGKGTTATILFNILKRAEKDVHLVGNIGNPMLDILPKLKKDSISILELSSFQLQDLDVPPDIAVIVDISPDHLDYHKSFNEYIKAKFSICNLQFSKDKVFYFTDNKYSRQIGLKGKGKKYSVNPKKFNLFSKKDLKIFGPHNFKNALMASCVAKNLGVSDAVIKKTVKNFRGLPQHLEFVRELKKIKFYNDSASTNPASTIAAIRAFKTPIILIVGGKNKGFDYTELGKEIKNSSVKLVILIGENHEEIKKKIQKSVAVVAERNLRLAVFVAFKNAKNGDSVVFSPASASFDMFKNSKERGEVFNRIVKKL